MASKFPLIYNHTPCIRHPGYVSGQGLLQDLVEAGRGASGLTVLTLPIEKRVEEGDSVKNEELTSSENEDIIRVRPLDSLHVSSNGV